MSNQDSKARHWRTVDMVGQRWGALSVVSYAGTSGTHALWNCVCDCGADVVSSGGELRRGGRKFCAACAEVGRTRAVSNAKKTHGMTAGNVTARIYRIWTGMRSRCTNPRSDSYEYYGGRGIAVCDRWLKFENFLEDMGDAPQGMTLDRVSSDLGYSKENCRWACIVEQNNNKRNNTILQINGVGKTIAQWAREPGAMSPSVISWRFHKGWPNDKAVFQEKRAW